MTGPEGSKSWIESFADGDFDKPMPTTMRTESYSSSLWNKRQADCIVLMIPPPTIGVQVYLARREILSLSADSIKDARNYYEFGVLHEGHWFGDKPLAFPLNEEYVYMFVIDGESYSIVWVTAGENGRTVERNGWLGNRWPAYNQNAEAFPSVRQYEKSMNGSFYSVRYLEQDFAVQQFCEGHDPFLPQFFGEYSIARGEVSDNQFSVSAYCTMPSYNDIRQVFDTNTTNDPFSRVLSFGRHNNGSVLCYEYAKPSLALNWFDIDATQNWESIPSSDNLHAAHNFYVQAVQDANRRVKLTAMRNDFLTPTIVTQEVDVSGLTSTIKPWHLVASFAAGALIMKE